MIVEAEREPEEAEEPAADETPAQIITFLTGLQLTHSSTKIRKKDVKWLKEKVEVLPKSLNRSWLPARLSRVHNHEGDIHARQQLAYCFKEIRLFF